MSLVGPNAPPEVVEEEVVEAPLFWAPLNAFKQFSSESLVSPIPLQPLV